MSFYLEITKGAFVHMLSHYSHPRVFTFACCCCHTHVYSTIISQRRPCGGDLDRALSYGFSGPMLRGAGVAWDLRVTAPYDQPAVGAIPCPPHPSV